jgi:NADPH:quinone reductase-like Zn-dependent oxidoreductase
MRAITLNDPDTPPAAREDLPAPTPTDNEVLVRVHASSMNPVDGSIAAGLLAGMGVEYEYPVTLGRDYAGTVEQTGAAVSGFKPGDQVFRLPAPCQPDRPRRRLDRADHGHRGALDRARARRR